MNFINLTPHTINLMDEENDVTVSLESEGFIRALQHENTMPDVYVGDHPFPCIGLSFGAVSDMPAPETGTAYIVSQITAQALKEQGRTEDIFIVTEFIRNEDGQIIGATKLAQL